MEKPDTPLAPATGGVNVEVRAKPRSAKPGVGPVEGGALVVRLSSAPADGAANEELVRLLAKAFSIPKSAVEIVRGETSRHKRVYLKGVEVSGIAEKLKGCDK